MTDIEAIANAILDIWRAPVAGVEAANRNADRVEQEFRRATRHLSREQRERVLQRVLVRAVEGPQLLRGAELAFIARHKLAALFDEVEQCMLALAPMVVVPRVSVPEQPSHSGISAWDYADPLDRDAIHALRAFAKRHGAWAIFVENEQCAKTEHWRHVTSAATHGPAAVSAWLSHVEGEDRAEHERLVEPHAAAIDEQLRARGMTDGDVAAVRNETLAAVQKRKAQGLEAGPGGARGSRAAGR